MSSERPNDGGPAFPVLVYDEVRGSHNETDGMSLRDWFAGKFAAAWVVGLESRRGEEGYSDEAAALEACRLGLMQADYMIEKRAAK